MKKFIYPILGLLILIAAVIGGCGKAADINTSISYEYDLRGGIVKNLDTDSTEAVFVLTRNGNNYTQATMVLSGDTIVYDTTIEFYRLSYDDTSLTPAGIDTLHIVDSSDLNEKFAYTIPEDFYISSISLPENRINAGGSEVQIQWAASLQNDGYIFAVVLKDSTYINDGYTEFVDNSITLANIPPDAFRIYGDTLTLGWYYVYIYSYTDNPASTYNLPTSIPAGLTDNIDNTDITGRYGSILVSPRDSIFVDAGK